MPMFGGSQFERLLGKATDEQVTEPDWMGMMAMCDLVRQQETMPSTALSAIRKQLFHRNSQVVVNTLLVLECLVKNCGQPVHEEVTQYEFLEELKELVRTGYSTVRTKVLSLIASWNEVFKGEHRYNSVKEAFEALKTEGFQFPELNNSEDLFDAARAPDWEDGRMCHLCRQLFSITKRKHHCRNCGQIFCAECTSDRMPLPHYGIEKEVRVCSICSNKIGSKTKSSTSITAPEVAAVTTSGASSSTRQPAANPQVEGEEKRKQKELELKEKEELDLAIALSLSQQEAPTQAGTVPESAPCESAPAENLYAEVEHVKPYKPAAAQPVTSYYPDLSSTVISNGLYPAVGVSAAAAAVPEQQQIAKQMLQPEEAIPAPVTVSTDHQEHTQQVKDLTEMLMRKLNMAAMKGQHVGTDPHIQTLLASLTSLHPKLVTDIEETERKMKAQKLLLTKIGTCKQARESLNKMRQEHLEKVRQQEEEQSILMRLQMEQKLELLRQQKLEQLKYQEELKRKHEQALVDREMAKMGYMTARPAQPNVVMSTHVNPSNYVSPQPVVSNAQPYHYPPNYMPPIRHPAPSDHYIQPHMGQQVPPHMMMGQPPQQQQMVPPQMGQAPQQMGQHPQMGQPPQQQMGQPPQQQMGPPPPQQSRPQYSQPPPQMNHHQPPMNQPPMSQPPMNQPPMSQPHMNQPPMSQPHMNQPPISHPSMGQPPMSQPPMGQPQSSQPEPPAAHLSNRDVMSALSAAPAPPTEALPPPAPRQQQREPPVADLISF